jgi:hypothetical protein
MELLDRYLQAVGFWLPKNQKQDILAELSEDLRSQIEDRERELGHPLDSTDLQGILKRCGSPILVASRYLPQEHLIGPVLFPIYRFALKMFALLCVVPWLAVWLVTLALSPGFRAAHPGVAFPGSLGSLLETVIYAFGFTTMAFALVERSHLRSAVLDNWNPDKLPAVRDPNRIPRSSSVIAVVAGLVFIGWWMQLPRNGAIEFAGALMKWSPVWKLIYWALPLQMLAGAALAIRHIARPFWTRSAAAVRLMLDLATFGFCYFLLKSGPWIVVESVNAAQAGALQNLANATLLMMFVAIAVGSLIGSIQGVRRVAGLRPFRNPLEFLHRLEQLM